MGPLPMMHGTSSDRDSLTPAPTLWTWDLTVRGPLSGGADIWWSRLETS